MGKYSVGFSYSVGIQVPYMLFEVLYNGLEDFRAGAGYFIVDISSTGKDFGTTPGLLKSYFLSFSSFTTSSSKSPVSRRDFNI